MSDLSDEGQTVTSLLTDRWTRQRLRVQVVEGPDKGLSLDFEDTIRIGKRDLADLVLSDPTVSSLHCEIANRGELILRDLGSKNGTFVGNVRVIEAVLPPNEPIRVGATVLQVRPLAENVVIPLRDDADFHGIVGTSPVMRALTARLERLAASDATVLVQGETGTGKELVAEALHHAGARRDKPLVVVDCGSLPASLIESELMGHERGAFTGAVATSVGAFERADGGTIFLDEIGELPLLMQPKLLRLLESRSVRRVGGQKSRDIDVRVISATNRDLAREVQAGRFREDLYFRLAVVRVEVPPLRQRIEDIPLLAAHLLRELGVDPREHLVPDTVAMLQAYDWPGNVRELRNQLTRMTAMPDAALPTPLAAPPPPASPVDLSVPLRVAKQRVVDELERAYIGALLDACGGRIVDVARRAGMDRMTIYRIIDKLKLKGTG
jgi:two-component system response regulator GlrR